MPKQSGNSLQLVLLFWLLFTTRLLNSEGSFRILKGFWPFLAKISKKKYTGLSIFEIYSIGSLTAIPWRLHVASCTKTHPSVFFNTFCLKSYTATPAIFAITYV